MTSCMEGNNSKKSGCNWDSSWFHQLKHRLEKIEKGLFKRVQELEKEISDGVLAGEPPPEPGSLLDAVARIDWVLQRYGHAEGVILSQKKNLQQVLDGYDLSFREIQMERDVLLERVHSYLETNSSLRVRLEEQRCQTAALQRRLEGDLDSEIRTLEEDKKRLKDLAAEKDKEIFEMNLVLEQQLENWNSETGTLRKRLHRALEDKEKLEGRIKKLSKGFGGAGSARRCEDGLRRWKSEGNFELAPRQSSSAGPYQAREFESSMNFKITEQTDRSTGRAMKTEAPASVGKGTKKNPEVNRTEPVLQAQLNAVKHGLVSVTQKLKVLKFELGPEETADKPSRNLKRKAEPLEIPEVDASGQEDCKPGFKNLKEILEDAKSLNVKLQTLREEKQKKVEKNKKENAGVQVEANKTEKWSQTAEGEEEASPLLRNFQKTIGKLRNSVWECEEKLDGGLFTKDEAVAVLVSAFSACISSNSRRLHDSEKTALSVEMDPRTPRGGEEEEEESKKSKAAAATKENGGGDNLLKKEGQGAQELKVQIARLKQEIERLQGPRE